MGSFQEQVDAALKDVAFDGKYLAEPAHFIPIAEDEDRAEVLQYLPARHIPDGKRVHIGVGGVFNLQMAAETKPDRLLLLDANKNQPRLWYEVIALLKDNPTQEGFWAAMQSRFRDDALTVARGKPIKLRGAYYMRTHPLNEFSMPEDGYRHLHQLAREGKIACAVVDLFNDRTRCAALGGLLREQELQGDSMYWSNVASGSMPEDMYPRRTLDPVFRRGGKEPEPLEYNDMPFAGRQGGIRKWDGEEYPRGKKLAFEKLPAFERLLRNVSAVGGETGTHCFLDMNDMRPLIMTDGPPRRTPETWARREEARVQHAQAHKDGKVIY
jgi:hypothetical protein